MNIIRTMLKTTTILIVVFSFIGCENDFDTLGTEIIGEPGFNADLYDEAEISAYTNNFEAVQSNNLPLNLLGVYNNPVFGTQVASVLSQLTLSTPGPDFGDQPVLDSVVLNLPYFSSEAETDEDGVVSYQLDSVYGDSSFKFSILHSNLLLNAYDPDSDFQNPQRYYSNMQPRIESNLTGNVLYEAESFRPSPEPVIIFETNDEGEQDTVALAPRMRIKLENDFFQQNVLDKSGAPELTSNNNFQNFIRGLYFKAEPIDDNGSLMLLNFRTSEAGITLYYTNMVPDAQDTDDDGDITELVPNQNSFKINFGPNIVNTFEQENQDFNDDRLHLRGGEGSMAVIELFSDPGELEDLRASDWLVNEANLYFYVDQSAMSSAREPEHLFLYDINNRSVLADYVFERPGEANPESSVVNQNHLGSLERDDDGNGVRYKMRITNHVRNILTNDSTNTRLGLVVSQNINIVSNAAVIGSDDNTITRVPAGSVISPLGTVLYGPNAENEEKRLKLRIYYTEPKN